MCSEFSVHLCRCTVTEPSPAQLTEPLGCAILWKPLLRNDCLKFTKFSLMVKNNDSSVIPKSHHSLCLSVADEPAQDQVRDLNMNCSHGLMCWRLSPERVALLWGSGRRNRGGRSQLKEVGHWEHGFEGQVWSMSCFLLPSGVRWAACTTESYHFEASPLGNPWVRGLWNELSETVSQNTEIRPSVVCAKSWQQREVCSR